MKNHRMVLLMVWTLLACALASGEARRKVIIDQDALGPAGTDENAILVLVQSPEVDPLGITVVTGDGWRDEEVAHTLRMLEIIGRSDIPVVPGAVFPLVNSRERALAWEKLHGRIRYMGAWFASYPGWKYHDPYVVPPLKEGNPTTKPSSEDAAHFMVRMVRQYPHEVTIYAAGPLTNLALAMKLDPHFPELAKELVVMGGSMNPVTDNPEFSHNPQREFNFWFDPEAADQVLHGKWPSITCTTVDISVKTHVTQALLDEIAQARTPAAQYVSEYTHPGQYMWDELAAAAWVDPSIITKEEMVYLDTDVDDGAGYGNTLSWAPGDNPGLGEQLAHVQQDLDTAKLYRLFIHLMTSPTPGPTPGAHAAASVPSAGSSSEFRYDDKPEFKAGAVNAGASPGGYSSAAQPASLDIARLKQQVALNPSNAQARYDYALALWRSGTHLPEVESQLMSAVKLDPRFADAHLQLGALYAEQAKYAPAIEQYRQAIRLRPNLAAAHYRLAQAYLRIGNHAAAKTELDAYNRLH
ncbi:MAG TPA: nucleoside hydrolase [Terriglobia bacterium]|nr:nucleoside hydrolase [Terriglobia bacterium]